MSKVIETVDLCKSFGPLKAVDEVSLSVGRGEIYGFLGLNGAGKTTTIRMLLGMIKADRGNCLLWGKPLGQNGRGPWERVGSMVELPFAYPQLTVEENLGLFAKLRGLGDREVAETIMLLSLESYARTPARNLSLGNNQRLGLAKALLHNPELLILDEPSNGLDPAGIVEIRELLQRLSSERGVTVFVSSHNLAEIAKIATRLGIIHRGRLIQEMSLPALQSSLRSVLLLETDDNTKASRFLVERGFSPLVDTQGSISLTEQAACRNPQEINRLLVEAGILPKMLKVEQEDLESYFLRFIGENE